MPITFLQLVDKAARFMEKGPPRDLSRVLAGILHIDEEDPSQYSVKDLDNALAAGDQRDPAVRSFGRLLTTWDHVHTSEWSGDTSAHSGERRALIYTLLKLPAALQRRCDE